MVTISSRRRKILGLATPAAAPVLGDRSLAIAAPLGPPGQRVFAAGALVLGVGIDLIRLGVRLFLTGLVLHLGLSVVRGTLEILFPHPADPKALPSA